MFWRQTTNNLEGLTMPSSFLTLLKSEDAIINFVTTGFTAFVTLTVVYIAHRLTHLRTRQELKSKKIEEAYQILARARSIGITLIEENFKHHSRLEAFEKYREELEALEMLAFLYIPEIEKYIEEMKLAVSHNDESTFPYVTSGYKGFSKRAAYLLSNASHARNVLKKHANKIA